MDYVLTLIGKNCEVLAKNCAQKWGGKIAPLGAGAFDIFFNRKIARGELLELIGAEKIDFAMQPVQGRRKKLLVSDMDSTIIHQETIDLLAEFLGVEKEVSKITEQAMSGQLNFNDAIIKRVAMFEGFNINELRKVLDKINLRSGVGTLTATMKKNGGECLLVSGGFTIIVEPTAKLAGFEAALCNKLEVKDGKLTGRLVPPIYNGEDKKKLMLGKAKSLGIKTCDIIAVGDGANDIEMIKAANMGVCFGSKKILSECADAQIKYNDISALLYIQGYSSSEFI